MFRKIQIQIFCLVLVSWGCGCSTYDSAIGSYMSDKVYETARTGEEFKRAVNYRGIDRNPVVIIHGFLGARLHNNISGRNVWGEIALGEALRDQTPEQLLDMALPMYPGIPLRQLTDYVRPDGLLTNFKVHFSDFEFEVAGYDRLVDLLEKAGYRQPAKAAENNEAPSLFCFYYDWRRDISENAAELSRFLAKNRAELQAFYRKKYGVADYDVKFDLIGHSMGGLVTRYFLRYGDQVLPEDGSLPKLDWRGAKIVDRAILAGTPNVGYVDTCVELVNGLSYARGATPYPPAVIGTFHSYYQMMPPTAYRAVLDEQGKVLDLFDPEVWDARGWGLLAENQDAVLKIILPDVPLREQRKAIAKDHLRKCLARAKQLHRAMNRYAELPRDLALVLFLGDSVNTSRQAKVADGGRRLNVVRWDIGDGKVLAASVRGDLRPELKEWVPYEVSPENWSAVVHLPGAHMGIILSGFFRDNLLYYLLAAPAQRNKATVRTLLEKMEDQP